MGTKRIYSLDFVKLVAIYLVLWGHCIQSLIPEVGSGEGKPVFLYIYSFHMSLFMIISGYFAVNIEGETLKKLIVSKFRQLIIPCISLGGLIILTDIVFNHLNNWEEGFKTFVFEIWFLKCLFLCYVVLFISKKIWNFNKLLAILFVFIAAHATSIYGLSCMLPCFFVGLGFAKYKYYLLNHLTAVLFFTSITYIVLLQWWDYDYAKYTFFNFFKFLMALNDPTVARPMLEGLLKEFYRICVGISGAVMILSFILLIFAKLPNVKLLNRLSVLGQYTLGIYVIQTVLLERIIKSVITFDASSFYYFNFLLAPAISLAVLICCIVLVKLFLRSKWTSFILLGK